MKMLKKQLMITFFFSSSLYAMENQQIQLAEQFENMNENQLRQVVQNLLADNKQDMRVIQGKAGVPTIILNVNDNKMLARNDNQLLAAQKALAKSEAKAKNDVKVRVISEIKNEIKTYSEDTKNKVKSFFSQHKQILGASAMGSVYGYFSLKLLGMSRYLKRKESWSAWRKEISLNELMTIDRAQLCQAFLISVQQKYINNANPTDVINPLVQCSQDIEHEMHYLSNYLTITRWLSRCFVFWIFPASSRDIKQAKKRLKRLCFLRGLFKSWAMENRLDAIQPPKLTLMDKIMHTPQSSQLHRDK